MTSQVPLPICRASTHLRSCSIARLLSSALQGLSKAVRACQLCLYRARGDLVVTSSTFKNMLLDRCRLPAGQHSQPGPGSYTASDMPLHRQAAKWTLGARPALSTFNHQTPGPGTYTAGSHGHSAPGSRFSQSKRLPNSNTGGPGPGGLTSLVWLHQRVQRLQACFGLYTVALCVA